MKVAHSQLPALFQSLGLAVELVEDEATSEFNSDSVLQAVDAAREPVIKQRVEAELTNSITDRVKGQAGLKLRQILRDKTGIAIGEIKDLPTDIEAITKALEYRDATYSKDTEGVRQQLTQVISAHERALQEKEAAHATEVSTWKKKYADRDIADKLSKKLADAPFAENADRKALEKLFKNHLESIYDLADSEKEDEIHVYNKGAQTAAMNKTGSNLIDLKEVAKDFFTPLGVWNEDLRSKSVAREMQQGKAYVAAAKGAGGQEDLSLERRTAMLFGGMKV